MKRVFRFNRYCTVELVHAIYSRKNYRVCGDCDTDEDGHTVIRIVYDKPSRMVESFDHEMCHFVDDHVCRGEHIETVANKMATVYKHARRQLPFFKTALY
jgi:hypothetical protein